MQQHQVLSAIRKSTNPLGTRPPHARARAEIALGFLSTRPLLGIAQGSILPTKRKISRLITRRLIEYCWLARSQVSSHSYSCLRNSLSLVPRLPASLPILSTVRSPLNCVAVARLPCTLRPAMPGRLVHFLLTTDRSFCLQRLALPRLVSPCQPIRFYYICYLWAVFFDPRRWAAPFFSDSYHFHSYFYSFRLSDYFYSFVNWISTPVRNEWNMFFHKPPFSLYLLY